MGSQFLLVAWQARGVPCGHLVGLVYHTNIISACMMTMIRDLILYCSPQHIYVRHVGPTSLYYYRISFDV